MHLMEWPVTLLLKYNLTVKVNRRMQENDKAPRHLPPIHQIDKEQYQETVVWKRLSLFQASIVRNQKLKIEEVNLSMADTRVIIRSINLSTAESALCRIEKTRRWMYHQVEGVFDRRWYLPLVINSQQEPVVNSYVELAVLRLGI